MTLAEIGVFILILGLIYRAMGPLQRYLEPKLRKLFRSVFRKANGPVVDVTDETEVRDRKEKR